MERFRGFVAVGLAGLLSPVLTASVGLPLGLLAAVVIGSALARLTVVAAPGRQPVSGRR